MPYETKDGLRLTDQEQVDLRKEFNRRAEAIEEKVRSALPEGIEILSVERKELVCIDCPEYPAECRYCRPDANMAEAFKKPAIRITLKEAGVEP